MSDIVTPPVDLKAMRNKTSRYFDQSRGCARSTLLGICMTAGSPYSEKELNNLSAGFVGGIGNTYDEGPCGALASGVIALGMYFGSTTKCSELSKELYLDFKEKYGSPQCVKVIEKMRDHECVGCCHSVVNKVGEILNREYASRIDLAAGADK